MTGNCVAGNWFDNSSPWFDESSPSASWATAWATASAKQNDGEHAAGGEVSFGVQYVPYEGIEKTDYIPQDGVSLSWSRQGRQNRPAHGLISLIFLDFIDGLHCILTKEQPDQ